MCTHGQFIDISIHSQIRVPRITQHPTMLPKMLCTCVSNATVYNNKVKIRFVLYERAIEIDGDGDGDE